jgi:predicted ribosome quality control (RQC) complex YloA/Tae2 family protein
MKELFINNIKTLIGSNAKENWKLLEDSKPNNLFFHLSSFPSCYVILQTESDILPDLETIKETALVCKNNTKCKTIPNLKVDYTYCKNVIKGEYVGEIIYKSNKKVNQIKI